MLVEGNKFVNAKKALYSTDGGNAVARDNDFGDAKSEAPEGDLTSVPYKYDVLGPDGVEDAVYGIAGQTLKF